MNKLILIMIDGISAELFEQRKSWMPHLHALAEQGTQIQALTPEVCGTSFPGRTSIVVGQPSSVHGIYGNKIWDGNEFRWSTPYDVRTPTIATFAKEKGRDVASIGYGMVRPEDCNVYCNPWWVDDVMNRARDEAPHPTDQQWTMEGKNLDPDNRIAALSDRNIDIKVINPDSDNTTKLSLGMLADQQLLEIAAGLANSEQAPDLILLEIGITDYYLHAYGIDHPLTEWSIRTADSQVATLMERLRQHGTLDDYNFAILSDHGHAPMPEAIYCDQVLPEGIQWSSEGGMLLVAPRSEDEAQQVRTLLTEIGVEEWNNDFLPKELRSQLLTFSHPEDTIFCFEKDSKGTGKILGQSKYHSNHGMRPGTKADYRFCIFSGPRVPQSKVPFGTTDQVAPTLAALMDVPTDWVSQPLFPVVN